ncbi:serine hydroxymethyltransferase [Candidatus Bathyarchaeota archaeon]|nr:serine hydroxymethyltransferase [Candidatus Bathyarchaeota archaeon]
MNRIVEMNTHYRMNCLNLIASENVTSRLVDFFYINDFAHRYGNGEIGHKDYAGVKYLEKLEQITADLAKDLFKCKFVNLAPISGTMANLTAYTALLKKNDLIATIPFNCGSHISHNETGVAGVYGLKTVYLPFDAEKMNIDIENSQAIIERFKPKLIIVGASEILFPVPLKELREIAENSIILYDAAHVLGLIAGKMFQQPLKEGADLVTGSTHKTLFGPQGGIILTNNLEIINKINGAAWKIIANHHAHRLPALAVALLELKTFGVKYARQVVANAQALGRSLHERKFKVGGAKIGFTKSHQVLVDVADIMSAPIAVKRLEKANIITNCSPLPWNTVKPTGFRLGSQEMTRFGMKENDMDTIAEFIERILIRREDPNRVKQEVIKFRREFQTIHYTFTYPIPLPSDLSSIQWHQLRKDENT